MMGRAMLAVACWAAPTACGSGAGGGDEVFFLTWDTSGGVPEALLEDATLVRRDGCLLAEGGGLTADTLLVWPGGFRLEDRRVLDAPGREVARIGGPLTSGGGFTTVEGAEDLIREPVPAACGSPGPDAVWLVGEIEPPSPEP